MLIVHCAGSSSQISQLLLVCGVTTKIGFHGCEIKDAWALKYTNTGVMILNSYSAEVVLQPCAFIAIP